jgi:hypothetical protein
MVQSSADAPGRQFALVGEMSPVVGLLAIGLCRALARRHRWNESPPDGEVQVRVATGDQTRISPNARRAGASEIPP